MYLRYLAKFLIVFVICLFLAASVLGQSTLQNWDDNFHWDDPNNPPGTTYNFYESTISGGPWTKLNTAPIAGSPFNYPGRTVGNFYSVSAVASGGLEALSDELELFVPAKPLFLRLFQVIADFFRTIFGWWA